MVSDCRFGVSPVNYPDSDVDAYYKFSCPFLYLLKFILKMYTLGVPNWTIVLKDWAHQSFICRLLNYPDPDVDAYYKFSCPFLYLLKFILKMYTSGSHTELSYSRTGCTSPLYADSLTSCGHVDKLCLRKPRVLLDFMQILLTCVPFEIVSNCFACFSIVHYRVFL